MSYQWPLDPQALFGERIDQFVNLGNLPRKDVEGVGAAIKDMWSNAPAGWVYEWSKLAKSYAQAGDHLKASAAYGWAKFPTLADNDKRAAQANQLSEYLLGAPSFGVGFEREILNLPYQGGTTPVPVHIFTPADLPSSAPVLLATGGVDGWKMDVHSLLVTLAKQLRVTVLAFDIVGTGESVVPMTSAGGAEIVRGLAAHARTLGNGVVAHLGVSMGGHYSARSGLAHDVDVAVDWGGPVEVAFTAVPGHFGMAGIIGNAMKFDAPPAPEEMMARFKEFSLRPLLDQNINAPMLVINGADDVHIPQPDSLVFQGRRDTVVKLIPGTGHCAMSKLPEVMPIVTDWLRRALADATNRKISAA